MWISDKFIKWRDEQFSPYEEIKIPEDDLLQIKKVSPDVFDRLFQITEYRLAMEVVNDKKEFTKAEFDWAMKFAKYLREYFK